MTDSIYFASNAIVVCKMSGEESREGADKKKKKKLNDQTPTYGDTEQIIIPCLFGQPDKYDNNSDNDDADNGNRAILRTRA